MSLSIKRYLFADLSYTLNDYALLADGFQEHFNMLRFLTITTIRPDYIPFLYRNVRDVHQAITDIVPPAYGTSDELTYFRSRNWILKAADGTEVTDPFYIGNRYCDIGNPDYQKYLADWYYYYFILRPQAYKACFLDNGMCTNASSWHYGSVGNPINPRTGTTWIDTDVTNAYAAMYSVIKQRLLGLNMKIVANSIGASTGYKYFHFTNYRLPTIGLSQLIDGFMCEQWLSAGIMAYLPESGVGNYNWKDSVDMLLDFEAQFSGKNIILVGYAADDPNMGLTTDAEKQQYCKFLYASMLLGIGSKNTYWLFLGLWGWKDSLSQSLYKTNIGVPIGSYYKDVNGLYIRNFTNCIVTVNPSLTEIRGGLSPHTAVIKSVTQQKYIFDHWQDGDVNPVKTITV